MTFHETAFTYWLKLHLNIQHQFGMRDYEETNYLHGGKNRFPCLDNTVLAQLHRKWQPVVATAIKLRTVLQRAYIVHWEYAAA